RDGEQVLDLLREVQELQLAALLAHRGVAAHDLAEPGGVDVRNIGQVQQDLGLAAVDELVYGFAQGVVALADEDLPVKLRAACVPDRALDDLHGGVSPCGWSV